MSGHDFHIDNHSFIASGTTIGGGCRIGQMTFVGLGMTIAPQTVIAEENLITAGALVAHDTEKCGVYVGRPAGKVRSVEQEGVTLSV
jgi:carbonic anhydrase/acetyltransferase-like protein (isoleucine patch superfamily)